MTASLVLIGSRDSYLCFDWFWGQHPFSHSLIISVLIGSHDSIPCLIRSSIEPQMVVLKAVRAKIRDRPGHPHWVAKMKLRSNCPDAHGLKLQLLDQTGYSIM